MKPRKILSIDIGVSNFATCLVECEKGEDELVNKYRVEELGVRDQFLPKVFHPKVYLDGMKALAQTLPRADVVVIERQQWVSNSFANSAYSSFRMNMIETLLMGELIQMYPPQDHLISMLAHTTKRYFSMSTGKVNKKEGVQIAAKILNNKDVRRHVKIFRTLLGKLQMDLQDGEGEAVVSGAVKKDDFATVFYKPSPSTSSIVSIIFPVNDHLLYAAQLV